MKRDRKTSIFRSAAPSQAPTPVTLAPFSAFFALRPCIVERISSGRLDSKRAGLLLYALQIASLNLPKSDPAPQESVVEITLDDQNQTLAPINELIPAPNSRSMVEDFMESWNMQASSNPASEDVPSADYNLLAGQVEEARPDLEQFSQPAGSTFDDIDESDQVIIIPAIQASSHNSRRRKAHPEGWAHPDICRRSPNLPHTYACSTIGPARLNFRVRDGNGCDPRGKLTGKLENFALAIFHN